MTKIVLDGREVEVDPKKPLIAACHEHAAHVPMYCYHPGLSPVGSCRICQVEVKQGEAPARVVVACRTTVVEGMVVDTEAPKAHEARRQCLEFLLKNHPLDCPICDKAGECDLQDYAFMEGQGEGRSVEPRRKLEKRKSLGDVIVLDQERCILCSRCVRFFEEVTKKPQLTVAGLGARSTIETFADRPLEGNYQGNVADLCPVGALTLQSFRFQARVWNLSKAPSTCGECSRGCSITVEVLRKHEVKRLRPRPNPAVNQYWMCDHGRFSHPRFNAPARLAGALVRGSGGLEPVAREVALDEIANLVRVHGAPLIVASPWLTQEEGERARVLGGALCFISPAPSALKDDFLHTGDPCPNRRGLEALGFEPLAPAAALARMAQAKLVLLLGERAAELLGAEALTQLPAGLRLVLLDTHPVDAPAFSVELGVPDASERTGTWINVDG
ncbi:MAG: 2Fe-2S iron-sulfur cluster binding domain-containing protein, partial [Planctomycetes bacterium]|nr:2Fe-2S iron-sulfur cluster binding domain-containing protein [Planctomycetota bacterium]